VFAIRSQAVNFIRQYMIDAGFIEVETPMMQVIPGGAVARPFITHHNALDIALYLRVAPELYLKRLVVGGIEQVFEINRNFRNEGLSTRHNPEFTMLEFYQAYADYEDFMNLTEDMMRRLVHAVLGSGKIHYQGQDFDLDQSFARMSVEDAIIKYNPDLDASQLEDLEYCRKAATDLGIKPEPGWGAGKLQIEIFEKTVEDQLQPIPSSPIVSRCLSAGANWLTAFPNSTIPKTRPSGSVARSRKRKPATRKPCTSMPTIFVRWSTACHQPRARGSESTAWLCYSPTRRAFATSSCSRTCARNSAWSRAR
jgi:hypothetical protein